MSGRLLRALFLWLLLILGGAAIVAGLLILGGLLPFVTSGWLLVAAGVAWLIGTMGMAVAMHGSETSVPPQEEN